MTVSRSPNQRGFTLVEMMVALFIFALIAAAGVGLLQSSVTTQAMVRDRLGGMGDINRLRAIMTADLAQSVARPTRGVDGGPVPAFAGAADGFALVQGGAQSLDNAARPRLQKIRYALENGGWTRRAAPTLDGSDWGEPTLLAKDVSAATIRYRGPDGGWQGNWSPPDGLAIPVAVEVTLNREGAAPLTLRFLTAPAPAPATASLP